MNKKLSKLTKDYTINDFDYAIDFLMVKRQNLISMSRNIIDGLNNLKSEHINVFMRMYSHENLDENLYVVVNSMTTKKMNRAFEQIQNTLKENLKPKPKIVHEQKEKDDFEKQVKEEIFELVDDDFFDEKMKSARDVIGGDGKKIFNFKDEKYMIIWDGFWDKCDYYDWKIISCNVYLEGTRYLD